MLATDAKISQEFIAKGENGLEQSPFSPDLFIWKIPF